MQPNPNYEEGIAGLRKLLDLAIDGIGPVNQQKPEDPQRYRK